MLTGSQSESVIVEALRRLVVQGWLPLRQLSFLLGYRHGTGIYNRQKGPNAIPAIKVGSTYRVYASDIVHALENTKDEDRDIAVIILTKYNQLLREHQKQEGLEQYE